ncbi:DNA polymerase III subunit gamma/tau [Candidatus Saccharibacteria bacterium]|nr:DNA polymerase III subunit gamma/tau [Candidatus Saccharibacteria bacterium]
MGQALYRKYRSKKLSEIVGQKHITLTLQRAIKQGKINHAYLFTGPRGTGKTSIARILAHEINRLPYTDESAHLDIIEIDAASNRRIDEIRELRDKVHIAPTSADYKVYIIDEVHMLTKEAFNALLKTLEEPPKHVVFILATTEVHKLPETIISRTQRHTFKPIDEVDAIKHLGVIAKQEGMNIDEDALLLLARHGRGSFRDSISLLEQVGNSKNKITKNDAEKLIGLAASEHIVGLESATLSGSPAEIIDALDRLVNSGISPAQAAKQLAAAIRTRIISGENTKVMNSLLADLLKVNASTEPGAQLEISLFKANLDCDAINSSPAALKQPNIAEKPQKTVASVEISKPLKTENVHINSKPTRQGLQDNWWNEVLADIKSTNNTLYGILRMAKPHIDGDRLKLSFGFGFHQKKVADAPTKAKIRAAVIAVTGLDLTIEAVHESTKLKPMARTTEPVSFTIPIIMNEELSSITNIFGGGEVLDS